MADRDEQQEGKGFKVQDRRRFSETGEPRPGQEDAPEQKGAFEQEQSSAAQEAKSSEAQQSPPPLELNFSTFLISLSTQALAHLGEIPNPIDRKTSVDLGAARQLIDILGILKEKTKGNLDDSEAQLLDHALYDLRLKYVERSRGGSEQG